MKGGGLGDTQAHLLYKNLTQNWIMELNGKEKNDKNLRKKRDKFSRSGTRQRVLRLDPKSTIHIRKN